MSPHAADSPTPDLPGATAPATTVKLDRAEGRPAYEIFLEGEAEAVGFAQVIEHEQRSQGQGLTRQRIFPHTVVKEEFSGQGVASILVKHALDESIAAGYRIVPICSYVQAWIQRHEGYGQHVDPISTEHFKVLQG